MSDTTFSPALATIQAPTAGRAIVRRAAAVWRALGQADAAAAFEAVTLLAAMAGSTAFLAAAL